MVKFDVDLSGVKIPKEVGGVKIPKKLRKKGKRLIAKAQSPQGKEAIAAGLTIAGTVLAASARAKAARQARAADAPEPPVPPVPPRAPGMPGIDPGRELGDAIAAGIGALERFLKHRPG